RASISPAPRASRPRAVADASPAAPTFPTDPPPLAAPGRVYAPFVRASDHEPAPGGVVLGVEDAKGDRHRVRLTAWAPGVLRVQFRSDDDVPAHGPSPVLVSDRSAVTPRLLEHEGAVVLEAPGLRVQIHRDPYRLTVADDAGVERFAQQ